MRWVKERRSTDDRLRSVTKESPREKKKVDCRPSIVRDLCSIQKVCDRHLMQAIVTRKTWMMMIVIGEHCWRSMFG